MDIFYAYQKPHFQSPQYLNLWAQFQRKPVHRIHDKSKDKIFIYLKDHKKILYTQWQSRFQMWNLRKQTICQIWKDNIYVKTVGRDVKANT